VPSIILCVWGVSFIWYIYGLFWYREFLFSGFK
jgi:hypothetical protein